MPTWATNTIVCNMSNRFSLGRSAEDLEEFRRDE